MGFGNSNLEFKSITLPGLLESIYEKCLCKEFDLRGIDYKRQVVIPINYKGFSVDAYLKVDLIVVSGYSVFLKKCGALISKFDIPNLITLW